MYDVSVHLDESVVVVCVAHSPCDSDGRALGSPDCQRLYVYGVGASIIESNDDRDDLTTRLAGLRTEVAARNGVSTSRRMARFRRDGWHATEDQPEFADPLIAELDLRSPHKGHVRFAIFDSQQDVEKVHTTLFIALLRSLVRRYSRAESLEIVFEASSGTSLEGCRQIVKVAGGSEQTVVCREPKGSDLLALADYLLYAAMQYVARNAQLCAREGCTETHDLPVGATVGFDEKGRPVAAAHVSKDDRWHKLYFSFVRGMSSLVEVSITPEP